MGVAVVVVVGDKRQTNLTANTAGKFRKISFSFFQKFIKKKNIFAAKCKQLEYFVIYGNFYLLLPVQETGISFINQNDSE